MEVVCVALAAAVGEDRAPARSRVEVEPGQEHPAGPPAAGEVAGEEPGRGGGGRRAVVVGKWINCISILRKHKYSKGEPRK